METGRSPTADPNFLHIRKSVPEDAAGIWRILEPTIRAGETNALPREMSEADALAWWTAGSETWIAEERGRSVGTYYLRPNQLGGGAHVANAGYMTARDSMGRGIARRMGEHSLDIARQRGFRAMQFNFVVSTNAPAVHLWTRLGFERVGRLPRAFDHPRLGYVDALVMFRAL